MQGILKSSLVHDIIYCAYCVVHEARASTQDLRTIGLVEGGDWFPGSLHDPPRLTCIREHALSLHVG